MGLPATTDYFFRESSGTEPPKAQEILSENIFLVGLSLVTKSNVHRQGEEISSARA